MAKCRSISRASWASLIAAIFESESRHGVDERLILLCANTRGDGGRLAMRFGSDGRGAYVRHPNLDRAQTLLSQSRAMDSSRHGTKL
jgi:hypothetical protein